MREQGSQPGNSKLSRRSVLAGVGAATAAGTAMPASAATDESLELVLVRKPALRSDGRVVAPCVRSRLFVRHKGDTDYGKAVCDFVETPKATSAAFCSDVPSGACAVSARHNSLRGLIGLSGDSWELVIGDVAHAGLSPSAKSSAKLAISRPIDDTSNVGRMQYANQVEPAHALKQLKRVVSRLSEDANMTVIEDKDLFADFEIDIPNVGRHFA